MSKPTLLLFAVACFLCSCSDPPPPSLNAKDRELIDSLFRMEIKTLKPTLDSLCESSFDQRVREAVDSMMVVRQEEIEKQLKRIRQQ